MSPDTVDNLARIGKFILGSTMVYVFFVVVYAWMKDSERSERGALDAEAEAFHAGYEAGYKMQLPGVAWQAYLDRREDRQRARQN